VGASCDRTRNYVEDGKGSGNDNDSSTAEDSGRPEGGDLERLEVAEREERLWEVGKWMFGTSVLLALVVGLFSQKERSALQVALVCCIQVRPLVSVPRSARSDSVTHVRWGPHRPACAAGSSDTR
jgi:hypothetical protein